MFGTGSVAARLEICCPKNGLWISPYWGEGTWLHAKDTNAVNLIWVLRVLLCVNHHMYAHVWRPLSPRRVHGSLYLRRVKPSPCNTHRLTAS